MKTEFRHISLLKFLRTHALIVLIVLFAMGVRIWQIDELSPLFQDSGYDILTAVHAVETGTVPLLGIPSSQPHLRQGPHSIWLTMISLTVFGASTYAMSILFALVGVAAVIGIYEITTVHLSRAQGIFAAMLAAGSPILIVHSRMIYHTTPIPLATVLFLASCMLLWNKHHYGVLAATLASCFALQFELAMLPLFMVPIYIWLIRFYRLPKRGEVGQAAIGLIVGLLPQILHDLQNNFAQLGGFAHWVIRRIGRFVLIRNAGVGESVADSDYLLVIERFWIFGSKIFTADYAPLAGVIFVLLGIAAVRAAYLARQKRLSPLWQITLAATASLLVAFIVMGEFSEAYSPVFFVLLIVHTACFAHSLPSKTYATSLALAWLLLIINLVGIYQHSFFVSNTQRWTYGPSTGEQRAILQFLNEKSLGRYQVTNTISMEAIYPSNLASYRWLAHEKGLAPPSSQGKMFFLTVAGETTESLTNNSQTFSSRAVHW